MKNKPSLAIKDVLQQTKNMQSISQTFAILDELNLLLRSILAPNLLNHCHIGAVDFTKNLVILYIDNPAIHHLINTQANLILNHFNRHHFSFGGILCRVSKQNTHQQSTQKPELEIDF